MFFDSVESLLNMGVHGKYVWSSYGITVGILLWNFITPLLVKRKIDKKIAVITSENLSAN